MHMWMKEAIADVPKDMEIQNESNACVVSFQESG